MAELNNEELKAQLAEAKAQIKERDDKVAALEEAVESAGVKIVIKPNPVEVSWKDPKGKVMKKKIVSNIPAVRLSDGSGVVVSTVALHKIANGETLDKEEKTQSPALANMTKEKAIETLTAFAKKGAAFLEEAK